MNRVRVWAAPHLVAVASTLGVGLAASNQSPSTALAQPRAATPPEATLAAADRLSAAFQHVAETIAPAVVTIRTTKEVETRSMPFFFESPLTPFGDGLFPRFEQSRPSPRRFQLGEGSGVVVGRNGHILTNSHVVDGADEVTVIFADETQYAAEVVGTDPKTDIAVIRIDAGAMTPARLGDSDSIRVGQWVVAAGNPFGLSSSITAGIVSAKGRSRVGINDYEDYIQTDAAINRGNSGGPLVNLRGEVIGINTAIMSRTGGNVGIGFAIPINQAREVMNELIEDGRVIRGYLGVLIQDLSEDLASSFGYERTNGALVSEVAGDGPAAAAGLEPGDIITRFDGAPVTDVDRLRLAVASIDPGTEVELTVFRQGRTRTLDVTIDELPTDVTRPSNAEGADLNLGMTVETLTGELAQRSGVDPGLSGVLVTGVEPMGPAARAGLRRGDVITHVQDDPVESTAQLRRVLREHDLKDGVRLSIVSDSNRRFAFLKLRR